MDPLVVATIALAAVALRRVLGRSTPYTGGGGTVTILPGQELSQAVLSRLLVVSAKSGVPLHVTSGWRSDAKQAAVMLGNVARRGWGALDVYRATDIIEALKRTPRTIPAWAGVITRYRSEGRLLSDHQRDEAADLRDRDWTDLERARVLFALHEAGFHVVPEPDHVHVELTR